MGRQGGWVALVVELLGRKLRRWQRRRQRRAHLRLGALGERLSARALTEIGVEILCRNYRNTYGEIDIVALEGQVLCFIEVKTRHRQQIGRPADAVDLERRRRYGRAARKFVSTIADGLELECRFDIVEVLFDGRKPADIRYLRDAFRPSAFWTMPAKAQGARLDGELFL